ncbi:ABC transporter permease [Streptococcus caprae]|uniref:ABC transporter permease n=1 Tax=Streptococcus caprae TaxID=1640501 RepID=A0ABV8CYB3_9STRE
MENWKFAISSIMGHKMRAFLTMLGIIIGVASVVVIMALGQGMTSQVTDMFSADQQDVQVYFESNDTQDSQESSGITFGYGYTEEVATAPKMQEEWLQKVVEEVDGVEGYFGTNNTTGTVEYDRKKAESVNITGINKTYFSVKNYKILAGRKFNDQDYANFSRVIMLDTKLAVKLFGSDEASLNKVVTVGSKSYLVVGVYEDPNAGTAMYGMASEGNAIMTNTQLAAEYNMDELSSVYLHIADVSKSAEIASSATAVLTQLSGSKDGHYTSFDMTKMIEEINSAYGIMTAVIGAIAGISLLVGGIGVMNIMLVSVTERTREIGLRKALGATRRNILTQFLIESMVLTLIGGLIGLAIAFGLTIVLGNSFPDMKMVIMPQVAIGSLIFSAVIGIIFGILPANKASKLNPIEALRYE